MNKALIKLGVLGIVLALVFTGKDKVIVSKITEFVGTFKKDDENA